MKVRLSFDRARKRLVLRAVSRRGLRGATTCRTRTRLTRALVFTTEAVRRTFPLAGERGRNVTVVHGPDEFEEIFRARGSWRAVRGAMACPAEESRMNRERRRRARNSSSDRRGRAP